MHLSIGSVRSRLTTSLYLVRGYQSPCVSACDVEFIPKKKFCLWPLRLRWPNRSALPLPPRLKSYAKRQAYSRQNGKGNASQNGKHIVSRMTSVFPGGCGSCRHGLQGCMGLDSWGWTVTRCNFLLTYIAYIMRRSIFARSLRCGSCRHFFSRFQFV